MVITTKGKHKLKMKIIGLQHQINQLLVITFPPTLLREFLLSNFSKSLLVFDCDFVFDMTFQQLQIQRHQPF